MKVKISQLASTHTFDDEARCVIAHEGSTESISGRNLVSTIREKTGMDRLASNELLVEEMAKCAKMGRQTIFIPGTAFFDSATKRQMAVWTSPFNSWFNLTGFVCPKAAGTGAAFNFMLPRSWDGGKITVDILWIAATQGAGNVVWRLHTLDHGALGQGAAWGYASDGVSANNTASKYALNAASFSNINAGFAAHNLAGILPYRMPTSASDTYAGDVMLMGARVFFSTDKGDDA